MTWHPTQVGSPALRLSRGQRVAPAPARGSAPASRLLLAEQLVAADEQRSIALSNRIDAVTAEVDGLVRRRQEADVQRRLDQLRQSGRIEASEHATLSRPEHLAALAATPTLLEPMEARPWRGGFSRDQAGAARFSERLDTLLAEAKRGGRRLSQLDAAKQAAREVMP